MFAVRIYSYNRGKRSGCLDHVASNVSIRRALYLSLVRPALGYPTHPRPQSIYLVMRT